MDLAAIANESCMIHVVDVAQAVVVFLPERRGRRKQREVKVAAAAARHK